jgi:hypothetical protein
MQVYLYETVMNVSILKLILKRNVNNYDKELCI